MDLYMAGPQGIADPDTGMLEVRPAVRIEMPEINDPDLFPAGCAEVSDVEFLRTPDVLKEGFLHRVCFKMKQMPAGKPADRCGKEKTFCTMG